MQSRIKELEKIERIEIPPEEKTIHFSFPQPKPSGRIVAEFKNVSKSYGDEACFGDVNFIIERGDRIALVGVNGAGKSTLIKLLAGAEPLTRATTSWATTSQLDYFAQDQYKELDPNARMLDDLGDAAPRRTQTELRDAARVLPVLRGRCVQAHRRALGRRAEPLRAGEDAAAAVELPAARRADEPPGHARQGRAADALAEFTGTVVFVSHDRYFIDKLATRVFEIGGGEVHVFPGNYEDYLWRKSGKPLDIPLVELAGYGCAACHASEPEKPAKRVNPMKVQKLKERCGSIEGDIARTEAEIATLEAGAQ